jgi:hypothetical protein
MFGQEIKTISKQGPYSTAIFDTSFKKALYKGSLDIGKHHLSGLFYFKRVDENSTRIIFTNEIGMNFFDLELHGNKLIVHSCFPSLNRKSLLKLLEKDFRLLLIQDTTIGKTKSKKSKDPKLMVIKVKSARGHLIYTYIKDSGNLTRIQTLRSFIGKTNLQLSGEERYSPKKIDISNSMIRLHIHMIFLSN